MSIQVQIICKKSILLFWSVCLVVTAYPQNGSPLLAHYRESNEAENQNWAICQDDNRIMMFANKRGILTFDGHNWDFIRIPVVAYAMKYKPDIRTVFIGSENNFGYIERNEKGLYNYYSLSPDSVNPGLVTGICFTDSTVWFWSERAVSRYNQVTGHTDLYLNSQDGKLFTGLFVMPGKTFINVQNEGLCRLESDTLFPVVTGHLLKDTQVLFSLPYDSKHILLGLEGGKLLLFDGIKFFSYQIKDEGYLQQNYLSGGIAVSDSLYAFSTLDGGVIIAEKNTGKVLHIINYARGLPDDEVYALGMDNNGGLWISHQYGLTRADLVLPVGNFNIYPGLKGNLTGSVVHNNELYVSTSEGVFYLAEEKQYIQVEVLVREEPLVPAAVEVAEQPAEQLQEKQDQKEKQQVIQQPEKTRRSLLSRIFGRKTVQPEPAKKESRKETGQTELQEVEKLPQLKPQTQPQIQPGYVKKTFSRLKSIDYTFRKVAGFDEKCRQMVSTPGGILASTNRGLMLISNHKSETIVDNRYVYSINPCRSEKYWISSADGYFCVTGTAGKWVVTEPDIDFRKQVYSAVSVNDTILWLGMDETVAQVKFQAQPEYVYYKFADDFPQRYIVDYENDTLFVFSESGIKYFNPAERKFTDYSNVSGFKGSGGKYVMTQPGMPWICTGDEWICLNRSFNISHTDRSMLKVFENIISIYSEAGRLWVTGNNNQIYRIQLDRIKTFIPDFNIFVKSITNERGAYFRLSDVIFGSNDNNIYFELSSPSYIKQNSTQYQYIVDRVMDDWSKWSSASTINLMLQPGKYTLRVRAKDIWGNLSEPRLINFTIKTPFTRTAFFYTLVSLAGLMMVVLIIKYRERRLQMEKRILEEKVRERTAEIEAQKEEITSSIEYAGRIQAAMLPSEEYFRKLFSDYFLIFKPRNIVSGDFYWIAEDEKNIYFTVADCTGHGVPGAFMSTLGISTLNEIITNSKKFKANTLLNILRRIIIESLHQTGKEGETPDGMDIAFCILDKQKTTLQYSGAFNPLIIFNEGELKEFKADKMPIGIHVRKEMPFTNHVINVNPGDIIYLFTDGITDQFGGPEGKKYKKSNFKKLLTAINQLPLSAQKNIIEKEYLQWKGNLTQVDDITILGVKI